MDSYRIFVVVLLLAVGAFLPGSALAGAAEGGGPETKTASPSRAPLKLKTVEFQSTSGESGKLTLTGIALPDKELFLFLDDKPLATVMPDGTGKWNHEGELKLGEGRHTLRADQYDEDTNMLAARAMVTIQRVAPGETPASETTSH
jgi:hypothetical protein